MAKIKKPNNKKLDTFPLSIRKIGILSKMLIFVDKINKNISIIKHLGLKL